MVNVSSSSSIVSVDPQAQAAGMLQALSYFDALEDVAKKHFQSEFAGILEISSGLDLSTTEERHSLLERFEKYPDMVISSSPGLTYQHIYASMAADWAGAISFQAIYDRLERCREIEPASVNNLLDLGAGYWNSSIAYEVAYPNIVKAIGIDCDPIKLMVFYSRTSEFFGVDKSKFEPLVGDFFTLADRGSELSTSVKSATPVDLAVMQNYFPVGDRHCHHPASSYAEMFKAVGELLSEAGRLVLIIDQRDYNNSPVLFELREQLEEKFRKYEDNRITPRGSTGKPEKVAVDVWVAGKQDLLREV